MLTMVESCKAVWLTLMCACPTDKEERRGGEKVERILILPHLTNLAHWKDRSSVKEMERKRGRESSASDVSLNEDDWKANGPSLTFVRSVLSHVLSFHYFVS